MSSSDSTDNEHHVSNNLQRVTSIRDPVWNGKRKKFFGPLIGSGVVLLIFFLGYMSYLFGTVYHQRYHFHGLKVLVVDFDNGGAVSQAIQASYEQKKGPSFPTLEFRNPTNYPDTQSVKDAVCVDGWWGAMYIHEGASKKLANAVASKSNGKPYFANDTVTYIYNQARYTTVGDAAIKANLEPLISTARGPYYQSQAGFQALQMLNRSDPIAIQAYLNPILPNSDIILPTLQGARTFYNTLNIVFPIILAFFYVLALNGIGSANNIWSLLRRRETWLLRFATGKIYTLIAALVINGYFWAFKEDWPVQNSVFATNWMITWFQMDIYWQVFDGLMDSLVPMQFSPPVMMGWIVFNVASAVVPFEIAPGFYHIGYIFPAYHIYSLQVRAWTGCTRLLHLNLPVLFAWWILGHALTVISVRKRAADERKKAGMVRSDGTILTEKTA